MNFALQVNGQFIIAFKILPAIFISKLNIIFRYCLTGLPADLKLTAKLITIHH
jgi:hypothetical protein